AARLRRARVSAGDPEPPAPPGDASLRSVRLDVWLDVACVFPTRSRAKAACEGGKVDVNGARAKAHREIHPGDRLAISGSGGRPRRGAGGEGTRGALDPSRRGPPAVRRRHAAALAGGRGGPAPRAAGRPAPGGGPTGTRRPPRAHPLEARPLAESRAPARPH